MKKFTVSTTNLPPDKNVYILVKEDSEWICGQTEDYDTNNTKVVRRISRAW